MKAFQMINQMISINESERTTVSTSFKRISPVKVFDCPQKWKLKSLDPNDKLLTININITRTLIHLLRFLSLVNRYIIVRSFFLWCATRKTFRNCCSNNAKFLNVLEIYPLSSALFAENSRDGNRSDVCQIRMIISPSSGYGFLNSEDVSDCLKQQLLHLKRT